MTIAVRIAVISCLIATMMTLSACRHSQVEQGWGQALAANISQMTANPEAGQQETGPIALDPHTGAKVVEGYYESQKRDKAPSTDSMIKIEY